MLKLTYKEYLSIALILAVIGVLGVLWQQPWKAGASVTVGNQYQSTTTPNVTDLTNLCPKLGSNLSNVGSSTTGVLGSIVVTGPNVGIIQAINATTSDGTKRKTAATSSLLLAEIPGKVAGNATSSATTYTFDLGFTDGLLIDTTALPATSTITYRCEN